MLQDGGSKRLADLKNNAGAMGETGKFFAEIFAPFDFNGINVPMPTLTFDGMLERRVGNKTVRLIEVGPAHTRGDVLAYVPEDRVIFTGDILFIEGHPIIWAGPIGNWIKACQLMLDLDVETIVPGHGPITDKAGVAAVKSYFEYIEREARKRYEAGLSIFDAARDISLTDYSSWGDAERIIINVATLYREFSGRRRTFTLTARTVWHDGADSARRVVTNLTTNLGERRIIHSARRSRPSRATANGCNDWKRHVPSDLPSQPGLIRRGHG